MKTIVALTLLIASSALALIGQDLPNSRGDDAIKNLKQVGQYDSLMTAFRSASAKTGQTEGVSLNNAVGQWAKLESLNTAGVMAISGNTAIMTGPEAAYVFIRSGKTWVFQETLTAPDGLPQDGFGFSASINGDTVVVGAWTDDVGTNNSQGSAYVFVRNGNIWTFQQKLTAADGAASDLFGYSVAISGETVVIGAMNDNAPAQDQGSAYVFVRSGGVWTQQQKLVGADSDLNDRFGVEVTISGDTVVVGANFHNLSPEQLDEHGAAYVFVRSSGTWSQQQKLTASDASPDDHFGRTVSISGDTLMVGADFDDVGTSVDRGSVYFFVRSGTTWTQQQHITRSSGSRFGSELTLSGDLAVIGSYVFARSAGTWIEKQQLIDSGGQPVTGVGISGNEIAAGSGEGSYIFRVFSNDWTHDAQDVPEEIASGDGFGFSVSVSGSRAAVGAPYDDVGSNVDQGSVYVFDYSRAGWVLRGRYFDRSLLAHAGDNYGTSVALDGDVMIVGAPGFDEGSNIDKGAVYFHDFVFETVTIRSVPGAQSGDHIGTSVDIRDVGGRAIAGAPGDDIGSNIDQGSVHFFDTNSPEWEYRNTIVTSDGAAGDQFGTAISLSRNPLNQSTFLAASPGDDVGSNPDQGSAYHFTFASGTWNEQKLTASDGSSNDRFGNSVAMEGPTAIIGASHDFVGANNEQGSAYVFVRDNSLTWSEQQKLVATDGAAGDRFGASVSVSSEMAVVGSPLDDIGSNNDQGSTYVFQRSGTTWNQIQRVSSDDGAAGNQFGSSVAISGDKFVAGAPVFGTNNSGAAKFYIDSIAPVFGPTPVDWFDYDGDGRTDLSIFRPSNAQWWILRSMNDFSTAFQFGVSSDKIVPADFTGDGKTDIAIFRPSNGSWFVLRSEDSSYYAFPFGVSTDIPLAADYDGDGKADAAVFRPSTGVWYIQKSAGGYDILEFGTNGDKPLVGDYDGDGKADLAVFRPNGANTAEWWIRRSSNGSILSSQFGLGTDRPMQADFTGDGKTDIAVWRPSNSVWHILRSEDSSYIYFEFGLPGDIPAAGDYDGDGRWDCAVFRPSSGEWHLRRSTSGLQIRHYGLSGDIPTPSAFVP